MCTREEIRSIVGELLAYHEKREEINHKELWEKLEQTLIVVRDSVPPSLSKMLVEIHEKLERNGEKLERIETKIAPVTDALDVAGKIKKGTIWVAGFVIALAGIIESIPHIKKILK